MWKVVLKAGVGSDIFGINGQDSFLSAYCIPTGLGDKLVWTTNKCTNESETPHLIVNYRRAVIDGHRPECFWTQPDKSTTNQSNRKCEVAPRQKDGSKRHNIECMTFRFSGGFIFWNEIELKGVHITSSKCPRTGHFYTPHTPPLSSYMNGLTGWH